MRTEELKERARHELIEYAANAAYLAIVFAAFTMYKRLIPASHDIACTNFRVALIEALIPGKVIMVGRIFRLGRGLDEAPGRAAGRANDGPPMQVLRSIDRR
jgi:hypothetical protein